ncbi:unnamed protein product [Protopolystoma xenopodis]|uniref:Protein kinase domain-containing protein n=1 Tax=Protopolystoma xenopodis TaxID=117903 RepID=A0A3S5BMC4_9PLAT|nr:unnamed protein product [Protopolystoma xenopodis]
MLVLDPDRRITAAQALCHPYLALFHDDADEPTSELFFDPLEGRDNITMDEWKGNLSSFSK